MDLRKLRNRPESELARFKNAGKRITRPLIPLIFVVAGVSTLISLAILFVLDVPLMPTKQTAPIKKYGTVFRSPQEAEGEEQEAEREERPASESTQGLTDSPSSSEPLTNPMSPDASSVETFSEPVLETEPPAVPTQRVSDSPTSSEEGTESTAEEARRLKEAFEGEKAEIKQMLAEGEADLAQAHETLNQATSLLARHLKTASPEEQLEFLEETRRQLARQLPPEIQERIAENPALLDAAWEAFLERLAEHGYTPPY